MTVKKLTVNDLKKMVKEAVTLQMKQSAAERRQKMKDDKAKANKVNENRTVKVTVEQLRSMVKEAVRARLKENMGMPGVGDLVAFKGRTGYVEDVSPEGKVGVTRDGVRMEWLPVQAVQVLASADELEELSPEEIASLDGEMGMGANQDPGEDPQAELDRLGGHLSSKLIGGGTRKALGARSRGLASQLGLTDDEY